MSYQIRIRLHKRLTSGSLLFTIGPEFGARACLYIASCIILFKNQAYTAVRPDAKSCSATRRATARAIFSPPTDEGSMGLA